MPMEWAHGEAVQASRLTSAFVEALNPAELN
jgi:hypothetical protein